jgi:hypothetical protein
MCSTPRDVEAHCLEPGLGRLTRLRRAGAIHDGDGHRTGKGERIAVEGVGVGAHPEEGVDNVEVLGLRRELDVAVYTALVDVLIDRALHHRHGELGRP